MEFKCHFVVMDANDEVHAVNCCSDNKTVSRISYCIRYFLN